MFSDDDCLYDEDSGNDSPEDEMEDEQEEMDDGEADDFGIDLEPVAGGSGVVKPDGEEEFSFEVRTLDLTIRGGGKRTKQCPIALLHRAAQVVSTEKIVGTMSTIVKEVAAVVDQQITPSMVFKLSTVHQQYPKEPSFRLDPKSVFHQVRILLNRVRWDKERLMERLYSGDQEAFFAEAQVSSQVPVVCFFLI